MLLLAAADIHICHRSYVYTPEYVSTDDEVEDEAEVNKTRSNSLSATQARDNRNTTNKEQGTG